MRHLLFLALMVFGYTSLAQENTELGRPIAEISLLNLDRVSLDTKDQIFASKIAGDIYQFNSNGNQLNIFSPARQGRLQQLEAAWTVNIFSFSADLQEYRILDRFMNTLVEKGLPNTPISLAKAATLGNNNIVWVWDESDLSLKSLDYLRDQIIQSQSLNLILPGGKLEVLEIREFKNRLFMNVADSGVYIFDNHANLIVKIPLKIEQQMCFYKEHLLWVQNGNLMAISLETKEKKLLVALPYADIEGIQIGQERLVLVSPNKLYVFPIPKWLESLEK